MLSLSIINNKNFILNFRVIFGIILIAAMSQITIPAYPVPITLQTVAAILIGLLYKPRAALLTWLAYLTCGATGLPVFLNFSSGLMKFTGPTAGYLIGMTLAAFIISWIRNHFSINLRNFKNVFTLVIIGQVLIYSLGVAWLSQLIGFNKAIISGFLIFIPSGIVKSIILSVIFRFTYHAKD